jgi:hypothetical protein
LSANSSVNISERSSTAYVHDIDPQTFEDIAIDLPEARFWLITKRDLRKTKRAFPITNFSRVSAKADCLRVENGLHRAIADAALVDNPLPTKHHNPSRKTA